MGCHNSSDWRYEVYDHYIYTEALVERHPRWCVNNTKRRRVASTAASYYRICEFYPDTCECTCYLFTINTQFYTGLHYVALLFPFSFNYLTPCWAAKIQGYPFMIIHWLITSSKFLGDCYFVYPVWYLKLVMTWLTYVISGPPSSVSLHLLPLVAVITYYTICPDGILIKFPHFARGVYRYMDFVFTTIGLYLSRELLYCICYFIYVPIVPMRNYHYRY